MKEKNVGYVGLLVGLGLGSDLCTWAFVDCCWFRQT
jgi:hypothetical protein